MRYCSSLLLLLASLAISLNAVAQENTIPPRLAVVIAVDQMRGDYLARFGPYFGAEGFNRLVKEGYQFTHCNYPYAMTKTAPGHATILSGVGPDVHGIIGNDWPDPVSWKKQVAVQDTSVRLVGMPEDTPDNELQIGRSPKLNMASTVGDVLKARYGEAAKVVGISNKDRASVLMAGRKPDLVLFDNDGRYISSTYYTEALPAWLSRYNEIDHVTPLAGTTWDRLIPDAELYKRVQGPDDVAAEGEVYGMGRTMPKTLPKADTKDSRKDLYTVYDVVPQASHDLGEVAKLAVTEMGLGQDDTPDLLALGFSQIDFVGHTYGPDSHEVFDAMLRLDLVIADFLKFLDAKVGAGHYTVVLTADHGVTPFPETVKAKDPSSPAERVSPKVYETAVKMALTLELGAPKERDWATKYASSFYLDHGQLKAAGIPAERAAQIIKDALVTIPSVAEVYTRADMEGAPALAGSYLDLARKSYYAERSPDVSYLLKPNCLEAGGNFTNHGTPYDYDTHVPLVFFGYGVKTGASDAPVYVTQLAPTISKVLGIAPPEKAKESPLLDVLE